MNFGSLTWLLSIECQMRKYNQSNIIGHLTHDTHRHTHTHKLSVLWCIGWKQSCNPTRYSKYQIGKAALENGKTLKHCHNVIHLQSRNEDKTSMNKRIQVFSELSEKVRVKMKSIERLPSWRDILPPWNPEFRGLSANCPRSETIKIFWINEIDWE